MLTSVMTMTEMPHGRQIRGSPKNLLASNKPSKLDCRQQALVKIAAALSQQLELKVVGWHRHSRR